VPVPAHSLQMHARHKSIAYKIATVAFCCAVPFEEDDKDPSIWFLDHSYLENMFRMFKKVNGELKQLRNARDLESCNGCSKSFISSVILLLA
jgi:hypothetical protein